MKRIILYILTLSMLIAACNCGTLPAEALVQTGGATPSGTAISNLAGLKAMTASKQYYLTQDIVMDGPFTFPAGVTLNGNGYALLPPSGTSQSSPYGLSSPVSVNSKNCLAFFRFTTGSSNTVTFQNISFGKVQNVFYLKDTGSMAQASLSLFADNYNTNLILDDVDFHVYLIDNTNAGDTAGFIGTVYNTVTMTDCNMSCVIDSLNSAASGYGACYFARDNSGAKITMTRCKTLAGSRVEKYGQSAGFVSNLFSQLTLSSCDNYADINQVGGNHAGGFVASFDTTGTVLTFTKCSNYGNVKGLFGVGGFLGNAAGATGHSTNPINVTFTDCLNVGDVGPQSGYGERIGGYVGRIYSVDVKLVFKNCVNLGHVSGPEKGASSTWGYYYDSVGQFVGGIMASGGKTGSGWTGDSVSQPYYPNNTVVSTGHPWYPQDNLWDGTDGKAKWHYYYGTHPVKFTNCFAYGRFSVTSGVRELSQLTGTYMTDAEADAKDTANEQYNPILTNGDVPHYGFMGASCMVDTTSSGNHQLLANNSLNAKWAYASELPQSDSAALEKLNTWMTAQGKPTYVLDGSSGTGSLKDVFAVARPEIPAYLCTASHDTIRILGGINTKSYKKVGFSYSIKVGSTTEFATQDYWTTSVYTTAGLKTAEQLGYEYLYEMTFLNVPTSGTVTLTLIPKAVSSDGNTTYTGQTYTLTFTNGKFTKCTVT